MSKVNNNGMDAMSDNQLLIHFERITGFRFPEERPDSPGFPRVPIKNLVGDVLSARNKGQ
jgi:hypothetical protein